MLPVFKICLAPKKSRPAIGGASSLRGSIVQTKSETISKESITEAAKKLYAWVQPSKSSKLRMLASYQAAGGLSFVSYCYHRSVQAFVTYGEQAYGGSSVKEDGFIKAVLSRHIDGDSGIFTEAVDSDFK